MIYWDRMTLKTRAKGVLSRCYWMTFLALIIAAVLGGEMISDSFGAVRIAVRDGVNGVLFPDYFSWWTFEQFVGMALLVMPFRAAYGIFIGNVMSVGRRRYLTLCRYGEVDLGELFSAFRNGRYWVTVKIMFIRGLYVFLWSLLFVIPGIIKRYAYWMVPYIIAENPGISSARAFEISCMTTKGEKWGMFVLQLSFIGWFLLGALACGIGSLFVMPYYEATQAELYGALRYKAVMCGLCGPDEIGKELFSARG